MVMPKPVVYCPVYCLYHMINIYIYTIFMIYKNVINVISSNHIHTFWSEGRSARYCSLNIDALRQQEGAVGRIVKVVKIGLKDGRTPPGVTAAFFGEAIEDVVATQDKLQTKEGTVDIGWTVWRQKLATRNIWDFKRALPSTVSGALYSVHYIRLRF